MIRDIFRNTVKYSWNEKANKLINAQGDFFITSAYCDIGVRFASMLISDAINKACLKNIYKYK